MYISKEKERSRNNDSLNRIRKLGLSFSDAFDEDDEIVIYGFSVSGHQLFEELYGKRNIVAIIDNIFSERKEYRGVPIHQIYNDKVEEYLKSYNHLKFIVTPTYDWDEVVEDIKHKCKGARVYPLCSICAILEVDKFVTDSDERNILHNMVLNEQKTSVKRIHLVDGMHGLLIYLIYHGGCRNTLFLMQNYEPDMRVLMMIKKLGGIVIYIGDKADGGEYIDTAKYDIVRALKYHVKSYGIKVYGQDLFPYVLEYMDCDITIIEDGFNSAYTTKELKKKYPGIYYGMEGEVCYARYDNVKEVIFVKDYEMPDEYRKKAKIVNLMEAWSALENDIKEEILQGFSFSSELVKEIRNTNRKVLLVGSNYSGCMLCSQETEIEMFREVMSNYDEKDIIIKPHPMSTIDYEKIFPDSYVIKTKFPIEVLMFCNIGIEKVVGIVSNGIVNLRGIYDIDEYPEIKVKYIEDGKL